MFGNFAQVHGFYFLQSGQIDYGNAMIYRAGKSRSVSDIVSGTISDFPTKIFNYIFVTESTDSKGRKYDESHHFFVIDIDFQTPVPGIILRDKSIKEIPGVIGRTEIKLEGNFSEYYDVDVEKEFEMETFQIFSPDIMQNILELAGSLEKPKFGFEFSGNRSVFFMKGEVNSQDFLEKLFGFISHCAIKWGPILKISKGDIEAVREQFSGK